MAIEEALKEAYASSPVDELALDTIELHHPAFLDDFGQPTAVRLVLAYEDYVLGLEDTAPLHAGEMVTFLKASFTFTNSGFSENETPSIQIAIGNVSRLITRYLEQASQQTDPILVIYRPYIASDPSGPQINPVVSMQMTSVESGLMSVSGTATLSDVHNWPFPNEKYTPVSHPGLMR